MFLRIITNNYVMSIRPDACVTILDFILVKNPLSSPSIPFLYPMKTREKKKNTKKEVYQRKETLNMYVRVSMHVMNS